MMLTKNTVLTTLVLSTFVLGQTSLLAEEQSQLGGAIIVRTTEKGVPSHCINPNNDSVYMHLRRIIVEKEAKLFGKDKSVGVLLETEIEGQTLSSEVNDRVVFPRLFEATVEPYATGLTSIPLEQMIFNGLKLTTTTSKFRTIRVDVSILKKKRSTTFGAALASLAEVTKEFPLPPANPFSDAFQYFATYAEKTIRNSLTDSNNVDENIKNGALTFTFSPNGNCEGDFEKTGTFAIVRAWNEITNPNAVVIGQDYCWQSTSRPTFDLRFASVPANGKCDGVPDDSYRSVRNPYTLFILNAVASNVTAYNSEQTISSVRQPVSSEDVELSPVVSDFQSQAFLKNYFLSPQDFTEPIAITQANILSSYLSSGVETAIEQPLTVDSDLPVLKPIAGSENYLLKSSNLESLSYDLVESLQRCELHGIDPDTCLGNN